MKHTIEWVKVANRLPDKAGLYLTHYVWGNGRHDIVVDYFRKRDHFYGKENTQKWVRHWAELPEPPKE